MAKNLYVELHFWKRGKGHVRAYHQKKWKPFVFVREAREFALANGYTGIRVKCK